MARIPQSSLFSWEKIEASSEMNTLKLVLEALPDEELMLHLEALRGKGRNDYPVRPMWNAIIAGIVFQLPSIAALRRELLRYAELRQVCGFDLFRGEEAVPSDDAFSHFLKLLIKNKEEVKAIFVRLAKGASKVLLDLGIYQAADTKALPTYARPTKKGRREQDGVRGQPDGRRDEDADWGVKTYRGMRKDGTMWENVKRWFGYKVHLLVDTTYELPLAFYVTKASENDNKHLLPLVEQLKENNPEIAERGRELAADKGYDSEENISVLYDEHGIIPVIDKRSMWKENPGEPRVLFGERYDVFSYHEDGRVYCTCPVSGEQRDMAFYGFEKDRGTLKYRCPAAAFGLTCQGRAECEKLAPSGVSDYGRVVRVPMKSDRRIFTPIARPTEKWKKAYARRTAVERVNSRIDNILGFERHTIRGLEKMEMRISLAMIVMLAMALGRIRENQAKLMRSITAPVIGKAA